MNNEDPDIELIKARKMKEMMSQIASQRQKKDRELDDKKIENKDTIENKEISNKEILLSYLYDRGDEVLSLAEIQFPSQTKILINRIVELIKYGEINRKISGGELLSVFRSIGLNIRINTSIKIEDHGKFVSFSERLKQSNNDKIKEDIE